ncbi:hypothetical protein BHE74_00014620 [Ensete ventricosum]|nr:hypothetical protein BHE74_00014620 [Ensete ventricosum]
MVRWCYKDEIIEAMTDKEKGATLVQSKKEEDGSRLRAGSCLVLIAERREGCYLRLEGNRSAYRMVEAIVTGSDNVNIGAPGMVKEAVVLMMKAVARVD